MSNFIVQALRGEPLTLYGDGSQSCSFCCVDDLVEGMAWLMNGNHIGPINIRTPGEFTIRQLAELLRAKFELQQDDPLQLHPVIKLAQRELGR